MELYNAENKSNRINKIGIIYSYVKREFFPTEVQYITEKDALPDAEATANEIRKLGIEPILMPGNESLTSMLKKHKPDMVFNLVDSINGLEYLASTVPGILDTLGIPFTGTGLLGLALTFNKFLTKQLLQSARIPVPNFQLFYNVNDQINPEMRFPLISKLNEIHGAVEIDETAVSENEKQLRERLSFLIKTYDQPVIVEEFIAGREVVAYVLQGNFTKVYLAEKVFNKPGKKYIYATFNDQWDDTNAQDEATDPYRYEKYDDSLLKAYTRKAFDTLDMLGYGKFDVRIDASGRHYFVDSNANPAFGSIELHTAMGYIIQKQYGVNFQEILKRLINNTMGGNYFSESSQTYGNGNGSSNGDENGNQAH